MFYRVNKCIDVILILQSCFFNIKILTVFCTFQVETQLQQQFDSDFHVSIQKQIFLFKLFIVSVSMMRLKEKKTVHKKMFIYNYSLRFHTGSNSIS